MSDIVAENFRHIRRLSNNIKSKVDGTNASDSELLNELAGMFAVTIVATYEGIIKSTLIDYAGNFHPKYQNHIESDFGRLNARVNLSDLKSYASRFGLTPWVKPGTKKAGTTFDKLLSRQRPVIERRFRKDLFVSYQNLFNWRNAYAHERSTSATFNDVFEAHRVGQYVVRTFVKAFEEG